MSNLGFRGKNIADTDDEISSLKGQAIVPLAA